ncbi:hypothetical protein XENOCAPTIV_012155 [Xenoophorus captivus]|uniref:Uncharacterized protein n=1 Tax=Xenoophorus captivus TaxID=1517983 RepID=A0ABV0Q9K4_9TELE
MGGVGNRESREDSRSASSFMGRSAPGKNLDAIRSESISVQSSIPVGLAKTCPLEDFTVRISTEMAQDGREGSGEPQIELESRTCSSCRNCNLQISDSSTARNNPSQFSPATATGQETELSALLYPPLATYIKSLSHDSDSSSHTQTSLDTTVDYISSHGQVNLDNYDEEDEEEFPEMQFFPSLSILMEPLGFGGKLTLDAVKIDCSDFFQNA